jgi:hypothetical protein
MFPKKPCNQFGEGAYVTDIQNVDIQIGNKNVDND